MTGAIVERHAGLYADSSECLIFRTDQVSVVMDFRDGIFRGTRAFV